MTKFAKLDDALQFSQIPHSEVQDVMKSCVLAMIERFKELGMHEEDIAEHMDEFEEVLQ